MMVVVSLDDFLFTVSWLLARNQLVFDG